jgi:UDP-N-acetyl-D-galactosamine dehydrogenase
MEFAVVAHGRKIAVIGLGYVGLPIVVAFARSGVSVIGFDLDQMRIAELAGGQDRTREVDPADLRRPCLRLTSEPAELAAADFYIVAVPTPIDAALKPDLSALVAASETIARVLRKGDVVVYESTVYPGATEEDCLPILEGISGLSAGRDFGIGYSPERINPGDRQHRFESITKIVAGQDQATLEIVASVYGSVVPAGIYRAPSIRVAETAKVIENTQRDLNVAFMNELSAICHTLGIDTADVLAAAATKWNFVPFTPGLVGGHCIGIDPYYLTYRAEKAGYHPEVILAGRRVNDGVGTRIAREVLRWLMRQEARPQLVTILGLTFKENVPDIRNSKVVDIITELRSFGVALQVHDPLAAPEQAMHEYGITLTGDAALVPSDAVVLAVPHESYLAAGWPFVTRLLRDGAGFVADVKSKLDRAARPDGIELWRL